ncbi:hypothetical protein Tco_1410101 [Tanacetum coccineum]
MFADDVLPNHVGGKELNSIDGIGNRVLTKKEIKKDDKGMPRELNKEWKLNEKAVPYNKNVYHYLWHPTEIPHLNLGYKSIERDRLMVIEVMVAMDISLCSHFSDNENDVACRDLEAAFEYSGEFHSPIFTMFSWDGNDANYVCSDSLFLTPLCCDDIHDVMPRVCALAGCDKLVSEHLVIENYVSLIRKKFCWGTIFPIGLKRYRDPKEEPIKKEPLMELNEIG